MRDWRRSIIGKPTKTQVDALIEIGYQAEELWRMAYRRLLVAEQQSRRSIPLWGLDTEPDSATVTREQIEESLRDPDGAYQRLRRVMDAWCALWFWPLTGDEVALPTLTQWIDACQQILGKDTKARKAAQRGAATLAPDDVWQALADQEDLAIKGAGGKPVADVLDAHPWLRVCERTVPRAGLLPLAARLRHGVRARRFRSPARQPALGAADARYGRACRRGIPGGNSREAFGARNARTG